MIEVKNLIKRYGNVTAVDDITFKVEKGEILGFLGPNGAGKTTTMRILAGYMPPTGGAAVVAGFDVMEKPLEVKKRIGYMPEHPPLYLEMTVDDYLKFVARLKGIAEKFIQPKITEVCGKVGIEAVKKRVIKTLSKGYKQRVGLAQALIHEPEILILDEPTIGLDPIQIREVRELIKSLGGNHTVILSTHILTEVSITCNKVVIVNKGKLIAQDTPSQLAKSIGGARKLTLLVEGNQEEIPSLVSSVQGVNHIVEKKVVDGALMLTVECDLRYHVRKSLSQAISEKKWSLLELKVEETSLEDVFLHLMSRGSAGENPQEKEINL